MSKLVRYAAKSIAMEQDYEVKISIGKIVEILGPPS